MRGQTPKNDERRPIVSQVGRDPSKSFMVRRTSELSGGDSRTDRDERTKGMLSRLGCRDPERSEYKSGGRRGWEIKRRRGRVWEIPGSSR